MRLASAALTAFTLATFTAHAEAQEDDRSRPIQVVLGGGAVQPIASFNDLTDVGVNILGGVDVRVVPRLAVEARGLFISMARDNVAATTLALPPDGRVRVFAGTISGKWNIPAEAVTPYLVAGVGLYDIEQEAGTVSSRATNFGVSGGIGLQLDYPLISIFLEARWHDIVNSKAGINNGRDTNIIPISFGFILR